MQDKGQSLAGKHRPAGRAENGHEHLSARHRQCDIKTVSGMLGHFSAGFTLDIYAYVTTTAQKAAADTMSGVLAGAV